MSDIDKSQKSTIRKMEDEKLDMLFKVVGTGELEKLQIDIARQIKNENRRRSPSPKARKTDMKIKKDAKIVQSVQQKGGIAQKRF